ncbi:hypothetical protein N7492_009798 [Penicillium capsulatum]|uniref:Uncharacterized protein n=1 Tax=Penicillium capsulatum TaxID=69766 RepID=A0A9W9HPD2_9EURO|nr:hypothetical protein N7492_009798 [Penicillium capsulatum]KAJ6114121.1 hypothetical protein N7512_007566 [Penicillium capsulatum]
MDGDHIGRVLNSLNERFQLYYSLHGEFPRDVRYLDQQFNSSTPTATRRASKNRVHAKLLDYLANPDKLKADSLQADDLAIIWRWVGHEDDFFLSTVAATPPRIQHLGHSSPLLNSMCCLLKDMETQSRVDTVRGRLLLYFLALLVDERIPNVKEVTVVAALVLKTGWIAPELSSALQDNLPKWLAGGRSYVRLARELDGAGSLIFLPLITRSDWEHHCHPDGSYGGRILELLRLLGVPQAAREQQPDGSRNAHDVVGALVQHWFAACAVDPIHFVSCDPSRPKLPEPGRRIRDPRPPPRPRRGPSLRRWQSSSPRSQASTGPDGPLSGQEPLFDAHAPERDLCHVVPSPPSHPCEDTSGFFADLASPAAVV